MTPIVLALALSSAPAADNPQRPTLLPPIELRLRRCPDLDPAFVHHVDPPAGKGPLFAIVGPRPDGQPTLAQGGLIAAPRPAAVAPPTLTLGRCPGLIPVSR
jgi:hypothetical protein